MSLPLHLQIPSKSMLTALSNDSTMQLEDTDEMLRRTIAGDALCDDSF